MSYVTTELPNGTVIEEWVSPPTPLTHKTKGLSEMEFVSLFSEAETIKILNLKAYITNPDYDVQGSVKLDHEALEIGKPGVTYRQLLVSCFEMFKMITNTGIDMDHPTTALSIAIDDKLGLLDSPSRKNVILLGKPL